MVESHISPVLNEVDHPVVTTTPHHRRPVHKIAKHLDREMIGMGWSLGPDSPTCSILNIFQELTSTTLMKIVSEKWLEDLHFPMFCSCNSFVGKSEPAKDLDLWCVLQKRYELGDTSSSCTSNRFNRNSCWRTWHDLQLRELKGPEGQEMYRKWAQAHDLEICNSL